MIIWSKRIWTCRTGIPRKITLMTGMKRWMFDRLEHVSWKHRIWGMYSEVGKLGFLRQPELFADMQHIPSSTPIWYWLYRNTLYFNMLNMQHNSSSERRIFWRPSPKWITWKGICALPYVSITAFKKLRCTSIFSDTIVNYLSAMGSQLHRDFGLPARAHSPLESLRKEPNYLGEWLA